MKNLFAKVGLLAFLCLAPSVYLNAKVQDDKEPIAFTVVMYSDGTTEIHKGELTNEQIIELYRQHGDIDGTTNNDNNNNNNK